VGPYEYSPRLPSRSVANIVNVGADPAKELGSATGSTTDAVAESVTWTESPAPPMVQPTQASAWLSATDAVIVSVVPATSIAAPGTKFAGSMGATELMYARENVGALASFTTSEAVAESCSNGRMIVSVTVPSMAGPGMSRVPSRPPLFCGITVVSAPRAMPPNSSTIGDPTVAVVGSVMVKVDCSPCDTCVGENETTSGLGAGALGWLLSLLPHAATVSATTPARRPTASLTVTSFGERRMFHFAVAPARAKRDHSDESATTGSTRTARHAGIALAITAAAARVSAVATSTSGSYVDVANNSVAIS